MGSFARVGYCIPDSDFYLVLHGLRCRQSTNGLINQSINQSINQVLSNKQETSFKPGAHSCCHHVDRLSCDAVSLGKVRVCQLRVEHGEDGEYGLQDRRLPQRVLKLPPQPLQVSLGRRVEIKLLQNLLHLRSDLTQYFYTIMNYFRNIMIQRQTKLILLLCYSVSASHAVGRGFTPRPIHFKEHQ